MPEEQKYATLDDLKALFEERFPKTVESAQQNVEQYQPRPGAPRLPPENSSNSTEWLGQKVALIIAAAVGAPTAAVLAYQGQTDEAVELVKWIIVGLAGAQGAYSLGAGVRKGLAGKAR